jgi:predicted PurR-regulated permease PerM
MPLLLTFLALFGRLEVLGLTGLLVGPVVVSVAVVALRLTLAKWNPGGRSPDSAAVRADGV